MVISEAMAACVPVVISDLCGATPQVSKENGEVLSLDDGVQEWADAIQMQLSRTSQVPRFERGWRVAAQEYEIIYRAHSAKRHT